ncbi:hypothetical protein QR680_010112 [Steinernema hermaphroditum]|uniref:HTH OST-type domain-containing protein n=1 Tax=Steinernema hermaphroditum TaxID=289476 RepID=A0AA39IMT3_9BILA|nr:hypothetical protein QR680_010112 [Steinernema hermaphroditum]
MDEDLENIKVQIASTLVAGGSAGYMVNDFDKIYREDWDTSVPYEKFGYSSLLAFLKSIPDRATVIVRQNGIATVTPVKTDETAKILNLVDRTEKKRPPPTHIHVSIPPFGLLARPEMNEMPCSSTSSVSSSSGQPSELTYEALLDLVKQSQNIQVKDMKIKAKKRLNVDVTVDNLNKLFNCNAKSELEAYTIGFRGVVEVRPTKNGNGQMTYLCPERLAFSKTSLFLEICKKKRMTMRDVHALYQKFHNGSLFTTETANSVLGTSATSALGALREAYGAKLNFDTVSASEWDTVITVKNGQLYTIDTLKSQIEKFNVLYINAHEKYAVTHYANVPNFSVDTLNDILGTSASTKEDALTQALHGFATVKRVANDIHVKKIGHSKRDQFLDLLAELAPIYDRNLWKEYRRMFNEEATTYRLNVLLETSGSDNREALQQACGNDIYFKDDYVLNAYLIFYPAKEPPRRTNDFLRYQFVALIYSSKTISLYNLCLKLKKQFHTEYNLETMNRIFGCSEPSRKAIIDKYLKPFIRTEGKNDDAGMRLQLYFKTKVLRTGQSSNSARDDVMSISSGSTSTSRRDLSPVASSTKSFSSMSDASSARRSALEMPSSLLVVAPPPKLAPAQIPKKPAPPTPQNVSQKASSAKAPVAKVAPLSYTPTIVKKDSATQTEAVETLLPPAPKCMKDVADVLADFLASSGGIKLMVADVVKLLKTKYAHTNIAFPSDYRSAVELSVKLVGLSSGRLNIEYYNELAFVKPADNSKTWDPSVVKHITIPLYSDGIRFEQQADLDQGSSSSTPSSAHSVGSSFGIYAKDTVTKTALPRPAAAPPVPPTKSSSKPSNTQKKKNCVLKGPSMEANSNAHTVDHLGTSDDDSESDEHSECVEDATCDAKEEKLHYDDEECDENEPDYPLEIATSVEQSVAPFVPKTDEQRRIYDLLLARLKKDMSIISITNKSEEIVDTKLTLEKLNEIFDFNVTTIRDAYIRIFGKDVVVTRTSTDFALFYMGNDGVLSRRKEDIIAFVRERGSVTVGELILTFLLDIGPGKRRLIAVFNRILGTDEAVLEDALRKGLEPELDTSEIVDGNEGKTHQVLPCWMKEVVPCEQTPSTSKLQPIPTKLTSDLLVSLIKESKQITMENLKKKAKSRYKITITLRKLRKLFDCNATTELEAIRIGLSGVVKVSTSRTGAGNLLYMPDKKTSVNETSRSTPDYERVDKDQHMISTKGGLLNYIRQNRTISLKKLNAYHHKHYGSTLSKKVANKILGTAEETPLDAICNAFPGTVFVEPDTPGVSNMHCLISIHRSACRIAPRKARYTKDVLLSQFERFPRIYLTIHERYAIENFDVPDLSLQTLNRIFGISEETRKGALQKGLMGVARVVGKDSNLIIERLTDQNKHIEGESSHQVFEDEEESEYERPQHSGSLVFHSRVNPPSSEGDDSSTSSKQDRLRPLPNNGNYIENKRKQEKRNNIQVLLSFLSPIYDFNFRIEYRVAFHREPTVEALNEIFGVNESTDVDALRAGCEHRLKAPYDPEMDSFLLVYPANAKAKYTEDLQTFLQNQFIDQIYQSRTISLYNLWVKLKKMVNIGDLESLKQIFKVSNGTWPQIIEREWPRTIEVSGSDDPTGMRVELRYVEPDDEQSDIDDQSLHEDRSYVDEPLPEETSHMRESIDPAPQKPSCTLYPRQSDHRPPSDISVEAELKRSEEPVPVKNIVFAAVPPLPQRPTVVKKAADCQTDAQPPAVKPTNLEQLARELSTFLESSGGIELTVDDAVDHLKCRHANHSNLFPSDTKMAFEFCKKMVLSSCGTLEFVFYNNMALVRLADKVASWNPSTAQKVQIPFCGVDTKTGTLNPPSTNGHSDLPQDCFIS